MLCGVDSLARAPGAREVEKPRNRSHARAEGRERERKIGSADRGCEEGEEGKGENSAPAAGATAVRKITAAREEVGNRGQRGGGVEFANVVPVL